MAEETIRYEVKDGVATITLNRPDVLNSFDETMAQAMKSRLAEAADDDSVRAVLITGTGRGFCAGQDLAEVTDEATAPEDLGIFVDERYNPIIRAIRKIEKPFIAAVNGIAAGAGANLALACDIVIASDKASFTQSFCKIGLIPDSGGTFFLPRLIGLPRATALLMLGEKVKAEQAVEIGMIYKVFPHEELLEAATKTARYLATQPTAGLGLTKRGLNQSLSSSLDEQLENEKVLQTLAGQTDDYAEGVQAFLEKRRPRFTGR